MHPIDIETIRHGGAIRLHCIAEIVVLAKEVRLVEGVSPPERGWVSEHLAVIFEIYVATCVLVFEGVIHLV